MRGPGAPVSPHLRVVAVIAMFVAAWLSLPVRIERPSAGPSSEDCLTLADRSPKGGADDLGALERCAALQPDDVEILADLGSVYESAGRPRDAEAVYRRALDRDSDYADLHARLGRLLLARGEAAEARRHAERALTLQPNRQALEDLVAEAAHQAVR